MMAILSFKSMVFQPSAARRQLSCGYFRRIPWQGRHDQWKVVSALLQCAAGRDNHAAKAAAGESCPACLVRSSRMSALKPIPVLIPAPTMPLIMDGIDKAFTLHKLWEQPDPDAFIKARGSSIRAIAGGNKKRMDGAWLKSFPKLEFVANFGVGYDGVDAAWCGKNGVIVSNTPDVLTDEVADLAVALLLATIRQLPQADAYLRRGEWLKGNFPLTTTLRGRTIGIVALGRIGKAIAQRLEGFGVEIVYHGRNPQTDVPYRYYADLTEMAKAVDVLLSMAPGGAATHHMIDGPVLKALGPKGILINVGRGTVVDEAALIEALASKTILSAGLDVFEDEPRVPQALIDIPQTVLLPHVGSASHHTRDLMGNLVVDNLISWFSGKGPLTPVPETPWTA
jgi:lactate dehydrogenase-like 2-hydroxyacid dehydrogenase